MPESAPRNPEEQPASQEELDIAADALRTFVGEDAADDRARVERVADAENSLQQALEAKRKRDGQ